MPRPLPRRSACCATILFSVHVWARPPPRRQGRGSPATPCSIAWRPYFNPRWTNPVADRRHDPDADAAAVHAAAVRPALPGHGGVAARLSRRGFFGRDRAVGPAPAARRSLPTGAPRLDGGCPAMRALCGRTFLPAL